MGAVSVLISFIDCELFNWIAAKLFANRFLISLPVGIFVGGLMMGVLVVSVVLSVGGFLLLVLILVFIGWRARPPSIIELRMVLT